ncbi:MAG: hypothetical protein HFE75_00530 [Firmicutes bacterium]|jgi:sodium/proline symporter|nr:hypothetical protein [Bacillota bacterium]NBI62326.1 hypothetical protein [Clostridiales bacterium]
MVTKLVILVLYIFVILAIGIYSTKKASSYEGYNLAGRGNNKWIGGISTQSASTSGWMLLAMPGLAYTFGFSAVWMLVGWLGGSLINWVLLGKRLRVATEAYDAVSCVEYFEKRTGDKRGIVGIFSALAIMFLMIINSTSEFIGFGKLINAVFGIDYTIGVTIGLVVVAIYTFLGGYLAVSWTNLLQGALMFLALAIVPIVAFLSTDGMQAIAADLYAQDADFFQFLHGSASVGESITLICSGAGIAFMYPGMVHSLTGIMAIKNPNNVKDSGLIAIIWGSVALTGASAIGLAFQGGAFHTVTMFASSGLGAAFGPVVIASLFGNKINYKGAIACIICGFLTVVIWFTTGMSTYLFEVFPGFAVGAAALFVVSKATGGADAEITEGYEQYRQLWQQANAKVK